MKKQAHPYYYGLKKSTDPRGIVVRSANLWKTPHQSLNHFRSLLTTQNSICSFALENYFSLKKNKNWSDLKLEAPCATMASRYWVVSLPVQNSASSLWSRLQESISKHSFDTPLYRVTISSPTHIYVHSSKRVRSSLFS